MRISAGALLYLALALAAHAQNFSQRGFIETTGLVYPQAAPNDSAHVTGAAVAV